MRATAEDTMHESSHVDGDDLVIDDRPVIRGGSERRPGAIDDPVRSLRGVLRRWRLLVLLTAIGAGGGWLSAATAAEVASAPVEVDHYEASHVLVLDANIPETQTTLSVRNLNTLATRTTIGEVPRRVGERLGMSASDAAGRVRVLIRPESDSMEIIAVGETPARAEELADAYATELIEHLGDEADDYADEAVASAQDRLDEADANLAQVRADLAAARADADDRSIALLEQDEKQYASARVAANAALVDARADGVPVVPLDTLESAAGRASVITSDRFEGLLDRAAAGRNIEVLFGDDTESDASGGALAAVSSRLPAGEVQRVALGAVLGLLVGLMIVAAMNRLDNRVRSKRQVEEYLDLPVVAEVPTIDRRFRRRKLVLARTKPRTRFAEQYRSLASTVAYAGRTRPSRTSQVVLVTSPGPAEGKTTTVANLGAMLAEAGRRVLLVNCDFRRPKLHQLLGADDRPCAILETSVPNVDLVANAVSENDLPPTEVVAEQRKVIARARELYDVVVIDTAPLLATNDAIDLLDLVDDVILVLRAGQTTLQAADRAVETLERRRSHVLGLAVSDIDAGSSDDYHYYYGGYDYRESRPRDRQTRESRSRRSEEASTDGRRRRWFRRRSADAGEPEGRDHEPPAVEPVIDLVTPTSSVDALTRLLEPAPGRSSATELEAARLRIEVERLRSQREQLLEIELRALQRRQAEFEHQAGLIRLESERRAAERARRARLGRASPQP